ncbi:hypothetical protein GCM10022226_08870 [Sphaerisporangium flaviroseum]|uniref:Uncharacterized protein n=1 Tax=Sphaerisporangium flaviroseum TaxID=509199 RepID=A0ABP7HHE6_9ACTN
MHGAGDVLHALGALIGSENLAYEATCDGEREQRHSGDHDHDGEMGTTKGYRCGIVSG